MVNPAGVDHGPFSLVTPARTHACMHAHTPLWLNWLVGRCAFLMHCSMHAQARANSFQPGAPMFGRDGTDNEVSSADSEAESTTEEWSVFAEPHKPTPIDTELYHAWYAIACQDYNETLMSLQDCTRQAAISRLSTDVPLHLQDMVQRMVPVLTEFAEGLRVTALHVMLHRREPDTANIQEIMMKVLMKYVWKTLHTQKSVVGTQPLAGPRH